MVEKNREDHLKDFLDKTERPAEQIQPTNIEYFGPNTRQKVETIEADSNWIEIPTKELPYGKFYQFGTHIFCRPAKTKEIESFAIVNEKNPFDVQLKLNEMLSACTKIEFADKTVGTYRDIQSGDRETMAIIISRMSAKKGRILQKVAFCDCTQNNKEEILIDLLPANYVFKQEDEIIRPFFNPNTCTYDFEMYNDVKISIAPPTIGLTEDINNYIYYQTTKSEGKKVPNVAFMQVIPYLKAGKGVRSLTIENLEQEEYNFSQMNDEMFMVIYDAIDKISFGIEKIKGHCPKCSKEVYTSFGFPKGARALFLIPDAFKQLVRQRV
jgi:hypothetical protein